MWQSSAFGNGVRTRFEAGVLVQNSAALRRLPPVRRTDAVGVLWADRVQHGGALIVVIFAA